MLFLRALCVRKARFTSAPSCVVWRCYSAFGGAENVMRGYTVSQEKEELHHETQ